MLTKCSGRENSELLFYSRAKKYLRPPDTLHRLQPLIARFD